MDGCDRDLRPFNSNSVISGRWKCEHERLCAMKRHLGSERISPPPGFELATPWSEVGSANRSATRTLALIDIIGFNKACGSDHIIPTVQVLARGQSINLHSLAVLKDTNI